LNTSRRGAYLDRIHDSLDDGVRTQQPVLP
jgi:hypothetical protein